jgi:hypothetical protein
MSKIIPFRPKKKAFVERQTSTPDVNKVLSEMYQETGIDFLKVVTGDERENKKLRFKQYQDALQFQ